MSEVKVGAEPVDQARYKFTVNHPVHGMGGGADGAYRFVSPADAAGVPVAEAVLGVPGIEEVVLSDGAVTVTRAQGVEWCDLEEQVLYAIKSAVTAMDAEQQISTAAPTVMDDDAMYDAVAEMFRTEVNPMVAQHGGAVELIDVQDATVVLRMMGGCQGCGMASVTLRQGIEGTLKRAVPGFKGIQDITDHSAGTDPYFTSEKK